MSKRAMNVFFAAWAGLAIGTLLALTIEAAVLHLVTGP